MAQSTEQEQQRQTQQQINAILAMARELRPYPYRGIHFDRFARQLAALVSGPELDWARRRLARALDV
jgi:hypothetical protein